MADDNNFFIIKPKRVYIRKHSSKGQQTSKEYTVVINDNKRFMSMSTNALKFAKIFNADKIQVFDYKNNLISEVQKNENGEYRYIKETKE